MSPAAKVRPEYYVNLFELCTVLLASWCCEPKRNVTWVFRSSLDGLVAKVACDHQDHRWFFYFLLNLILNQHQCACDRISSCNAQLLEVIKTSENHSNVYQLDYTLIWDQALKLFLVVSAAYRWNFTGQDEWWLIMIMWPYMLDWPLFIILNNWYAWSQFMSNLTCTI